MDQDQDIDHAVPINVTGVWQLKSLIVMTEIAFLSVDFGRNGAFGPAVPHPAVTESGIVKDLVIH